MLRSMLKHSLVSLVLAVLFLVGCQSAPEPEEGPGQVTGQLLYNDEPAVGVVVRVHAIDTNGVVVRTYSATTNAEGVFLIDVPDPPKQQLIPYPVTIEWPIDPSSESGSHNDRLQGRYADLHRPPCYVQVLPGENLIESISLR
jgi:hypothetical protein